MLHILSDGKINNSIINNNIIYRTLVPNREGSVHPRARFVIYFKIIQLAGLVHIYRERG